MLEKTIDLGWVCATNVDSDDLPPEDLPVDTEVVPIRKLSLPPDFNTNEILEAMFDVFTEEAVKSYGRPELDRLYKKTEQDETAWHALLTKYEEKAERVYGNKRDYPSIFMRLTVNGDIVDHLTISDDGTMQDKVRIAISTYRALLPNIESMEESETVLLEYGLVV